MAAGTTLGARARPAVRRGRDGVERRAPHLTAWTALLGREGAFDMMVAANRLEAQGRRIVHLEIGEPNVPTPAHVVEAAVRALAAGRTRYAPPAGTPRLRAAVAESMRARGIDVTPEHVVITPGAKPILFFAAMTLIEHGDDVLVPSPGFPIFESVIRFVGGRPVFYPLDPQRRFGIDPDTLARRITPRTRVLVLNTPHNPTGGVIAPADMDAIAELAVRHDLTVITDEIYSRHTYDAPHASIAALPGMPERTVVIDGFSKAFSMTGWRLGFGVMPLAVADRITRLVINCHSCTATFVQDAGVAALTGPSAELDQAFGELRARRDEMVEALRAIPGVRCETPQGAFFAFPDVRGVLARCGGTSADLADRLLAEHGVATLPGTAFGTGGEGYLRLSYALSRGDLQEALVAVRDGLAAVCA